MGSKVIQRNLTAMFLYSSNAIRKYNKSLKKKKKEKKEERRCKTKYSRIRLLKNADSETAQSFSTR